MLVTEIASYVLTILIQFAGFSTLAFAACTYPDSPFQNFDERGTIQSPGYPTHYYGEEKCDWNLNPPRGTLPELLVMDIIVDTNVDGDPEAANVCHETKNFVNIGSARACGKEGPVCVAFMLFSSRDYSCHRTTAKYFPLCNTVLIGGWPLKVTFQTEKPDNKLGFQLNYTFVECGANLDEIKESTQALTTITTKPVESENAAEANATTPTTTTNSATTTMPTAMPTTTTLRTTTTTERTLATKPKTKTTKRPKATTMKSKSETIEPAPQKTNLVLTIVLVLLCVMFIIITVAVIFRKRLREWISEKPAARNGSANGRGINYTDAYIIPINKEHTYEQPPPTYLPSVPPPYRPPSSSTNNSNSTGYDTLSSTASGHANEAKPEVEMIENDVDDTIQI